MRACWSRTPGRAWLGYLLGFRHLTFFAAGPVGWVEEVLVTEYRGQGTGRALMATFEAWAAEHGCALVALATRRAARSTARSDTRSPPLTSQAAHPAVASRVSGAR
jgi:GNAT superfamily N-acetyltransferase